MCHLLTLCKYSPDRRFSEPLSQPFETAARCVCLEHFKTLSVLFPKRFDAARPFEVKSAFKHKRFYVDFSFVLTKFFEKNGKEAAL